MAFNSSGNVGIARVPSYRLDVNGNIRVNTTIYSSDFRLKKEIMPLSTNQIDRLNLLHAKSYYMTDIDSSEINFARMRYGFVAQDVNEVYPELVYSDKDGILGIDYVSIIPLLTEKIKLQDQNLKNLKAKIEYIMENMNIMNPANSNLENESKLYQNIPNPYNRFTIIPFRINPNALSAKILISSTNGQIVKEYQISKYDILFELSSEDFAEGLYYYSLVVDDKLIDSRLMMVSSLK